MKPRERKAEDGVFLLSCCLQEWVAVVPGPVFYTKEQKLLTYSVFSTFFANPVVSIMDLY